MHRLAELLVIVLPGSGIGLAISSGLPAIILREGTLPGDFAPLPLYALQAVVLKDGRPERLTLIAGKGGC